MSENRVINVLKNQNNQNYTAAFFEARHDSKVEDLEKALEIHKRIGINTIVYQYSGKGNKADAALSESEKNADFDEAWFELQKKMIPVFRRLGMKFIFQDAAPFPSGSCNGWFRLKEYEDKRKLCLKQHKIDVTGPLPGCSFFTEEFCGASRLTDMAKAYLSGKDPSVGESVKYIIAIKRIGESDQYDFSTAIDLSDQTKNGLLKWNVPEGRWTIFVYVTSYNVDRQYYMNLLDKDSCRLMIDSIYQPHVDLLKEEIGKTWLGFFYDEPEIGNDKDFYFQSIVGKKDMPLPWCKELEDRLEEKIGKKWICDLPRLWINHEENKPYHYEFMNIVTDLIRKNYNGQMYRFCKENGLLYFGHVIEDDDCDSRIGLGTGHYFRVEEYQDIAGIDLISHQLSVGLDIKGVANDSRNYGDGQFYHYGLLRMCSSLAHLDAKKRNRAFSETLALYGSSVGPKYRKYLVDKLNVNGVNHMIYVSGSGLIGKEKNFPYEKEPYGHYYRYVADYHNRLSYLLSSGKHRPSAAVLYHAENEWSNVDQVLYSHDISAVLSKNQIDYDLVSIDMLKQNGAYGISWERDCFRINGIAFKVILIPGAKRVPIELMNFVCECRKHGVKVVFVDQRPEEVSDLIYEEDSYSSFMEEGYGDLILLKELASYMRDHGYYHVQSDSAQPFLNFFHMEDDHNQYLFFHNGNTYQNIECRISIPTDHMKYFYEMDVMNNTLIRIACEGELLKYDMKLKQWESKLLVLSKDNMNDYAQVVNRFENEEICGEWQIETIPYYEQKTDRLILKELSDITALDGFERFAGEIIYQLDFSVIKDDATDYFIEMDKVYESVKVLLNGNDCGERIAYPYRFDISDAVKNGNNRLCIRVCSNVARGIKDPFKANRVSFAEPAGITGKVYLEKRKKD